MDTHFPKFLREIHHCVLQLAVFLLLTRIPSIEGQCGEDTDGPFLTCVESITLTASVPNTFFGVSMAAGHYMAVDANPPITQPEYDPPVGSPSGSGTIFPSGATPLTVTVEDDCGNPSSCVIDIINPLTELPVSNCPDFSETSNTDPDSSTFSFTPPTYGPTDVRTDGVTYFYHGPGNPALPTVQFSTIPALPGPPFSLPVGANTIVTTISDTDLSFSCQSTVTVLDNQEPAVTCPANFTSTTATVTFTATVTDNVDPLPTLTYDPLGPGDTFPPGQTTVTVTATDSSSNQDTCSFTVTVEDNQEPVVTCPADFTTDSTTVTFTATVTDNFDPSPTLTYAPLGPGDTFPLGQTTVTVTATDSSSNQGTCSFTVTVVEPTTTTTTTAATTTTTQESNVGSGGFGGSGSSSSSGSSSEDSSSNESD
ncbi:hyalin-like [Lytechinus variegatus]|uniref:hyalin-like n=1 Tax=Lytechinus variegatus TaxID=7654 RepID=UPI001BB0ECFC|nr:hyalin-like [Lytechinus variegatus]